MTTPSPAPQGDQPSNAAQAAQVASPGAGAFSSEAGAPNPAADAAAQIAKLKSDQGFQKSYFDKTDPGHAAAKEKFESLHKAAHGEQAYDPVANPAEPFKPQDQPGEQPQGVEPEVVKVELPIVMPKDMAPAQALEMHKIANEAVAAMGIERELASGAVQILQKAVNARGGRVMDQVERNHFEAVVGRRYGDRTAEAIAAVDAVLQKSKQEGREWLQRSCAAAGPQTALWVFDSLARKGGFNG